MVIGPLGCCVDLRFLGRAGGFEKKSAKRMVDVSISFSWSVEFGRWLAVGERNLLPVGLKS